MVALDHARGGAAMKRPIERTLLLLLTLAALAASSCGAYGGEVRVGYGYTGGNYYDDVFYTPPIDRGAGFYGYPY
jgi:hypothetical protein